MLHTSEKIIKHKVGLMNLAEELGNVSKACQVMGLSRDTFYRYKSAVEEGGLDGLLEKSDIRMAKVKQKIAGCYRTPRYAAAYCRITSYLYSIALQG